jgi:hypothetical protein
LWQTGVKWFVKEIGIPHLARKWYKLAYKYIKKCLLSTPVFSAFYDILQQTFVILPISLREELLLDVAGDCC